MKKQEQDLQKRLQERKEAGLFRKMPTPNLGIDFCSNDYFGLAQNDTVRHLAENLIDFTTKGGATGARLISGNHPLAEQIERETARRHNAEAALLFNSGFDANIGLLSVVPQRTDTILYDELCHASLRDGIRLSLAKNYSFRHNDLAHLEQLFARCNGNIYVVVESIYSMDGDAAPLRELAALCEKYEAALIVDEAHSTGIYGDKGAGLVAALHLEEAVFARVHTFGKAIGAHGAVVVGSQTLIDYLRNFARSFIYTTALPPHSFARIIASYEYLDTHAIALQQTLKQRIRLFEEATQSIQDQLLPSKSPIQGMIIEGNKEAQRAAQILQKKGFDVRPILSPTVPEGQERLRICLHSFNSETEILDLALALRGL